MKLSSEMRQFERVSNTVSYHKAGKKSTKKSDCQMSSGGVKQFGFVLVCIMSKNAQILAKVKKFIQ